MIDGHLPIAELATLLRDHGCTVVVHQGAQGRSARMFETSGYNLGCQALVFHHTATSGANPDAEIGYIVGNPANGGQPGWVIANVYVERPTGIVHLLASGPTYTEGRGGPRGIIAENGANRVSMSVEIANRGDGQQTYTPEQTDAVRVIAAVVPPWLADLNDWPDDPHGPDRVFAHHEWTTRKIDPLGPAPWGPGEWDMDMFRSDAADLYDVVMRPGYVPVPPMRLFDTRQRDAPKIGAGRYRILKLDGHPDIPHNARQLWVTLTAINPADVGYLTVWAGDGDRRPDTSNLNYGPALPAVANSTAIDVAFTFTNLYSSADVHVAIDVFGYTP